MEWSDPSVPSVPSGYPAHALPGNVGTMSFSVSQSSDTSDLDTSPHIRPNIELPSDQFTFSPVQSVFSNQRYPFYQTGEEQQQYFPQPSQGYQALTQVQHFQQNGAPQFMNSNQVYQEN